MSWSNDGATLAIGATNAALSTVVRRLDWPSRTITVMADNPAIPEVSIGAGPSGRLAWAIDGNGSSQAVVADPDATVRLSIRVPGAPLEWLNWQRDQLVGVVPASAEVVRVIEFPIAHDPSPQVVTTLPADTFGSIWASDDDWLVVQGARTLVIHGGNQQTASLPGVLASLDPGRSHLVYIDQASAALMRRPLEGGPSERLLDAQVWDGVVSSLGIIAYRPAGLFNTVCFATYPD